MNYHQTKKMFAFLFNFIQSVTKFNVHNNEQATLFYALLNPQQKIIFSYVDVNYHNLQVGRDKLIEGSRGILQVRQHYNFFSRVICEFLYTLALGAINQVSSKIHNEVSIAREPRHRYRDVFFLCWD